VKGVLILLALGFVPGVASAHEVLHTVERGKAIAVKAYFADGEVLAYTEYQVFSPADAKIPYQKGRTDRGGYVAFVANAPGKWRVKIADTTGHGLDLEVDASDPPPTSGNAGALATWAFVARPLVGVVAVAAIFAALIVINRRKSPGR
jgi:nickel transport protein